MPDQADLSAALSGLTHALDGSTFSETLTVSNAGPATATDVSSAITVPSQVTVTNSGHGWMFGGDIIWVDESLAAGATVSYTVTFEVNAEARGSVMVDGATISQEVDDPNLANNSTWIVVRLGSSKPPDASSPAGERSAGSRKQLIRKLRHARGRKRARRSKRR